MTLNALNDTHDPSLTSFVASANEATTDFPIQNLPFGVFRRAGSAEAFRGGVAIGDQVLDLAALDATGLVQGSAREALRAASEPHLNRFMDMGRGASAELRDTLSKLLRSGSDSQKAVQACLVAQSAVEMALPARIGDYSDFYASVHHATNVGRLFRPDSPLLPNYKWVPIGYHGRASSIVVSGTDFHRPVGQVCGAGQTVPAVQASRRLDYELEMGIFIGRGNALGAPISIEDAEAHVFGLCLLNDWSARDIQGWEYQPLGPFLAKSFATSISPWIVTLDALAPFRAAFTRDAADPQPLPYLSSSTNSAAGAFNITLDVDLDIAGVAHRVSRGNMREAMYWSIAQLVAHHTVNGCNLNAGDLFGSGTLSGPNSGSQGALLELTHGGKQPLQFVDGTKRTFLEDGDAVVLKARCEQAGVKTIGFGECRGRVLATRGSGR